MDKNKEYISRINIVIDYISNNLTSDLSLSSLAEIGAFSKFHFHRIFYSIIGETLNDFVKRIKLEKAANLILYNKDKSITEIAYECGFSSSANFARDFKQYFNVSAKELRSNGYLNESNNRKLKSNIWKLNSNNGKVFNIEYDYNDFTLDELLKEFKMKTEIKEIKSMRVAYVRTFTGYNNEGIQKSWDKLCKWGFARNLFNEKTLVIGMSHDNPEITEAGKCRYDSCITIDDSIKVDGEIGEQTIEGGKYAVYHFEGTLGELQKAYNDFMGIWVHENGFQIENKPVFEIYITQPDSKDLSKKFKSDIYVPVKPAVL